jgi:hypothetical protein
MEIIQAYENPGARLAVQNGENAILCISPQRALLEMRQSLLMIYDYMPVIGQCMCTYLMKNRVCSGYVGRVLSLSKSHEVPGHSRKDPNSDV